MEFGSKFVVAICYFDLMKNLKKKRHLFLWSGKSLFPKQTQCVARTVCSQSVRTHSSDDLFGGWLQRMASHLRAMSHINSFFFNLLPQCLLRISSFSVFSHFTSSFSWSQTICQPSSSSPQLIAAFGSQFLCVCVCCLSQANEINHNLFFSPPIPDCDLSSSDSPFWTCSVVFDHFFCMSTHAHTHTHAGRICFTAVFSFIAHVYCSLNRYSVLSSLCVPWGHTHLHVILQSGALIWTKSSV